VSLDLADLAAAAVEFYAPAAELKNIRLTLHAQGRSAYPGSVLIAQALGNLIDNALKFAPDDGSSTSRSADAPTVWRRSR